MARGNFGERLQRERELREVSPNEIVVATRISQRFLEALENEDWEKLPGGVFNRGFVRAIARYLGLDEEKLLAEYDLARGDQAPESPANAETRIPSPPKWIFAVTALGILLLLAALVAAGVYGWSRYSARHRARPSANLSTRTLPGGTPVSAAADPTTTANSQLELAVSATSNTHVRILADGTLTFDSEIFAGDTHHFTAETSFEITAADSGAVLLNLNGQTMPPIGSRGASGTMVLSHKDLVKVGKNAKTP